MKTSGEWYTPQVASKEELRTVGILYTKKGDTTENDLRKENGLKNRAIY